MDNIKKVIAPTDLSELSRVGVRYALDLARAAGAEVTVYHVVNYEELKEYAEKMWEEGTAYLQARPPNHILQRYQLALSRFLNDHFGAAMAGLKVRALVEMGAADKNIVELARKEHVDLIVMSTHGRTGLPHVLIGSVTEKVVRHAPCAVLSIHPRTEEKARQRISAVA